MVVNVVEEFKDKETKSILKPGISIVVTKERFSELTAGPIFVVAIEKTDVVEEVDVDIGEEIEEVDIEGLTVKQLKDMLDQVNIKYGSKAKKEELIALIEAGD